MELCIKYNDAKLNDPPKFWFVQFLKEFKKFHQACLYWFALIDFKYHGSKPYFPVTKPDAPMLKPTGFCRTNRKAHHKKTLGHIKYT